MYVKVFEKILDSSIWLESATTRVVWITLLTSKNQDQVAVFATVANLARRAGVTTEECAEAVHILESPDEHRPDQPFEGRRIERREEGWFVINGDKYKTLRTAEDMREQNRIAAKAYRDRKAAERHPESDDASPHVIPNHSESQQVEVEVEVEVEKEVETTTTGRRGAPDPEIPQNLQTQGFLEAWQGWSTYRRERKLSKWTISTTTAQLTRLSSIGPERAIAAILHSISNGWQGLFEDRATTQARRQDLTRPIVSTADAENFTRAVQEKLARQAAKHAAKVTESA